MRDQDFLVVEIFTQIGNLHGLQFLHGRNRRRDPNLVRVTGLVDSRGFQGAFRKAPAQDHDHVRMNERVLDDEPSPDGEKQRGRRARRAAMKIPPGISQRRILDLDSVKFPPHRTAAPMERIARFLKHFGEPLPRVRGAPW